MHGLYQFLKVKKNKRKLWAVMATILLIGGAGVTALGVSACSISGEISKWTHKLDNYLDWNNPTNKNNVRNQFQKNVESKLGVFSINDYLFSDEDGQKEFKTNIVAKLNMLDINKILTTTINTAGNVEQKYKNFLLENLSIRKKTYTATDITIPTAFQESGEATGFLKIEVTLKTPDTVPLNLIGGTDNATVSLHLRDGMYPFEHKVLPDIAKIMIPYTTYDDKFISIKLPTDPAPELSDAIQDSMSSFFISIWNTETKNYKALNSTVTVTVHTVGDQFDFDNNYTDNLLKGILPDLTIQMMISNSGAMKLLTYDKVNMIKHIIW